MKGAHELKKFSQFLFGKRPFSVALAFSLMVGIQSPVSAFLSPLFVPADVQSQISPETREFIFEWTGGSPPFHFEVLLPEGITNTLSGYKLVQEEISCRDTTNSGGLSTYRINRALIDLPTAVGSRLKLLLGDSLGNVVQRRLVVDEGGVETTKSAILVKLIELHPEGLVEVFSYRQTIGPIDELSYAQRLLAKRALCNALLN